jgi:inosine/xanthosine triphosphate pyrophosphatase family protein/adenylate kinase family enzyme
MLELFFITSNRSKLDHARFLCQEYDIQISKQKQYGIGYIEPHIRNRTELLQTSILDAVDRLKKVSKSSIDEMFIFIEDTSVIIDALSNPNNEFPGVDVKYWMQETTFSKLDSQLKENENNRNVIVRSDVVLFLPKILQQKLDVKYVQFTSSTSGTIVKHEIDFTTQPLYPWLNNKTFNKWFVPEGYQKPLSLLKIEDADKMDFRRGSFNQMIEFLKGNFEIKKRPTGKSLYKQLNLFNQCLFIVCGNTCGGKTTISEYLTKKYKIYHIEASDFMYLSYYEKHGISSEVKIGDFAKDALKNNPSIVVDQIIKHLNSLKKGKLLPVIISGFRSPEEIKNFKQKYKGDLDIQEVFINASTPIRFKRSLDRGRNDGVKDILEFEKIDTQQNEMGISIIKDEIGNQFTISNEGSFDEYYDEFESRFQESLMYLPNKSSDTSNHAQSLTNKNIKLEDAILVSMFLNKNAFLTTTQIAHLINSTFNNIAKKEKDNVSRYFNYRYYPFYEISIEDAKIRYKLSPTGLSYIQTILLTQS